MDLRGAAARLGTTPGDALLAVGLTVVALADVDAETAAHPLLARAVCVPVLLCLAWRRRHPVAVAIAVCALDLWLSATSPGPFPPQLVLLPVLLGVYTAAAWTHGRACVVAGATTLLLLAGAHTTTGDGDAADFLPYVLWLAPWAAGRMVRRRTLEAAAAATEAAAVRQRREQELREAQAEERDRIARELHDVVAHAVSLMVVQAGAERLRLGQDAARTREVLEAVETAGRHALGDLRQMLGVLRSDSRTEADELAPQPGLDDLPALLANVRSAGLPVELAEEGLPQPLPAGVALAAYRIVQEALTNALKHAGSPATTVTLTWQAALLSVRVAHRLPAGPPAQRRADGRGLLGMRERAAAHGGRVEAGPEDGCWVVHAELPTRVAVA